MNTPETDEASLKALIGERYQAVRELGRGGMALIYEAIDGATGKRVAIKQLRTQRAAGDGQMARLFEMEFHTLAQLAHPRVVAVYDYHKSAETAFYTMELLDGGDLREHKVLPWKVVCGVLCDVCSALSLLHSRRLVHRDVTPRNIRLTRDGKAKLIDFGAMVPFGTHKRVVGTPAFTAPEAVMGQPLDGRADLYSLGVTGYYALTGRPPYPARTFDGLRNAWRSPPALPSRYASDIPPDLDQLVMSLLNLQPSRRPASAGAVIERLTAIAGIKLDEQLQVQRSYLTTPSLVGRDGILQNVRREMIGAVRGRGTSIFLTGPHGVGLSRMVDACALEAKLASAIVLRADASDAQDGEWGGVRSLLELLVTELPTKVVELLVDYAAVLGHAWPRATELTNTALQPFSQPQEMRAAIQDSLLNLMEDVSRHNSVVITADDIDQLDEPSRAFVVLLAQEVHGRRIVVVAAAASEALNAGVPELQLLRGEETPVELQPLSPEDTERLLISVFGEVPNVRLLASRLHDLSSGLPAATMQLTQHLLDQNTVRFHDGSWLLPDTIDRDALPAGVSDMMRARIAQLDEASLTLAQAIALSQKAAVTLEECGHLLGQPDRSEVIRRLDRLIAGQVLRAVGDRRAFDKPVWAPFLVAHLTPERARTLHSRVAEMFLKLPDSEYSAAGHFLASGNPARAIDLLLLYFERVNVELADDPSRVQEAVRSLPSDWMQTLESALTAARQLARPRCEQLTLQLLLSNYLAVTAQLRPAIAREVVEQLHVDSGLADYETLSDTIPAEQRLGCALQRAQERYDATSEAERGLPPSEAIPALARVYAQIIAMAGASADSAFLQELPSLAPFAELSPAIAMVELNVQMTCCLMRGQYEQAHKGYSEILERIAEPGGIGLQPSVHRHVELSVTYAVASIEVQLGLPAAAERIDMLERDILFEVNAWRLRMLQALQRGDMDTADQCARKSELLKIRNLPNQFFEGSDVYGETVALIEIGDVARLRQTLERLDAMAIKYRYWLTMPMLVQGHILRLRGETAAAVELFSQAYSTHKIPDIASWTPIARGYLTALAECGRARDGRSIGAVLLEDAKAAGLTVQVAQLHYAMALVELAGGDYDAALAHLHSVAKIRERWPLGEVFGGACDELRARIAIAKRDQAAFEAASDQCAKSFMLGRNPVLIARHQRLLQDAERARLRMPVFVSLQAPPLYAADAATMTVEATTTTMEGKPVFAECNSFDERVARVLSLATEQGIATDAMLYIIRNQALTLVGQRGSCPDVKRMDRLVAGFLRGEIEEPENAAVDPDDFLTSTVDTSDWAGPTGAPFAPALLSHLATDGLAITGVFVFGIEGQRRPEDSLLSRLSEALAENNDVVPLTVRPRTRVSLKANRPTT